MWDCGGGATSGEVGERLRAKGWDNGLDSSRATGDESDEVVGRAWTGVDKDKRADSIRVGCDL